MIKSVSAQAKTSEIQLLRKFSTGNCRNFYPVNSRYIKLIQENIQFL